MNFNGLGMNLGNLSRLSHAQTRSISAENFTGEKGKAGMATEGTGAHCAVDIGTGWKISPSVRIEPKTTFTIADIPHNAAGAIDGAAGRLDGNQIGGSFDAQRAVDQETQDRLRAGCTDRVVDLPAVLGQLIAPLHGVEELAVDREAE